ncbi:MAG TPA: N-acetyltransferase [Saprospiraceae bacterium]|nr:N-acetyltransferase [Saprospiraceae bacterium]HMP24360.1 N-acetyltransferase [Saprospiraceae bacterium]
MQIRRMQAADFPRVWTMFKQIIDEQVYYSYDHTTTRAEIEKSWINEQNLGYVAETDGVVAGAYIVKPNQPGHGAHIANAAYMVAQEFRGQGIGRLLGEHSLAAAKAAGYRAMQYNMVIRTNTSAVQLWQSLGFRIIGTVPEAFWHYEQGYVDAYIMYRKL